MQSPYTYFIPLSQQNGTLPEVLSVSNASSWVELQSLPTEILQTANSLVVGNSRPYGTVGFGEYDNAYFFPPTLTNPST